MVVNSPQPRTASQAGHFGDREYVVACKGRPFTILTPTSLPTPTVTYVDHKLVAELKLRMTDLQCSRLHYGSKKLRILGKVSTSVQCVNNGRMEGNLHLKAFVVENLCENFDVHSIAGIKLNQLLTFHPSLDEDSSGEDYSEPTKTPSRNKKKKIPIPNDKTPMSSAPSTPIKMSREEAYRANPFGHTLASINNIHSRAGYPSDSDAWSPTTDRLYDSTPYNSPVVGFKPGLLDVPSPPRMSPPPRTARSPPGFPVASCSPGTNISRLDAMDGIMIGQLTTASNGFVFYPNHGPTQCLPGCRSRAPPVNCGYNRHWTWPEGFQLCGERCRGAFCDCLRDYNEYGYYG